ncbi:MAG TPA: VOC family protein [Acidimicrobiales bacterium]|nr:VOC family protein [Acidimicrobiales bacterium]
MPNAVANHVGTCVTDLARSTRFYTEALGFSFDRDLKPPDGICATLLEISEPVGLTAVYLTMGTFVLELLHYERRGNPAATTRVMNEPGLTHLSLTVEDLGATLALVKDHGGSVLEATNVGLAVMVRDPDGQLIELLPAKSAR